MRTVLFLLLTFGAVVSNAAPVAWTLDGVTFENGDTLDGSFVYDADTNTYSDILIDGTYTAPGYWIGVPDYTGENGVWGAGPNGPDVNVPLSNESNTGLTLAAGQIQFGWLEQAELTLLFDAPLTNAGGSLGVVPGASAERFWWDSAAGIGYIDSVSVISGTVSAVPVPAAVWLFGSALAGLGWLRRK